MILNRKERNMVQIIDTFSQIGEVFCNGRFDLKRWREYINTIYRNTSDIFEDDLKEYVDSGNYTYEDDILPILNRVQGHPFLETLHTSFVRVTNGLNQRIIWALYIRKTSKRNCFRLGGQPAAPVTIGELSSIYSAIRRNSSAYLNFTLILPPS